MPLKCVKRRPLASAASVNQSGARAASVSRGRPDPPQAHARTQATVSTDSAGVAHAGGYHSGAKPLAAHSVRVR